MRYPSSLKRWGRSPQGERRPPANAQAPAPDPSISALVGELRLESRGFLEVDRLVAALGIDDGDDGTGRDETLERITSKCLRARDVLSR